MSMDFGSAGARVRHDNYFGPERELAWALVVPFKVAVKQVHWERGQWVVRAREAGLEQKDVAKLMNLSQSRVHQIEHRHRRCFMGKMAGRPSPVEAYLAAQDDVKALAAQIISMRRRKQRMDASDSAYRPVSNPLHKPILSD